MLFDQLRTSGEYDYVLVDTRGGFAFESTDLCALADSFIVITEPDYTSFYQDRNLVSRVAAAARDLQSPPLLRAMIVNKAVDVFPQQNTPYLDTLEVQFRNELVKEFPVRFQDTHPVPVSIEALLAYKAQKIPYRSAPESMFCLSTLAAFTDILGIVTSRWTVEQVDQWNALVDEVTLAVQRKQKEETEKEQARLEHEREFDRLRTSEGKSEARMAAMEREAVASLEAAKQQFELKVTSLERELEQRNVQYEREFARSEALTTTTIALAGGTTASYSGAASAPASRSLSSHFFLFGGRSACRASGVQRAVIVVLGTEPTACASAGCRGSNRDGGGLSWGAPDLAKGATHGDGKHGSSTSNARRDGGGRARSVGQSERVGARVKAVRARANLRNRVKGREIKSARDEHRCAGE